MKAKILIVGGGIMGTSIALKTARRNDPLGPPVVLFEKAQIGAGSSGRSGAILRQIYADRVLAAMARDSLREYAAFEARAGRSIGYKRTGVLTLAGPEQADRIEKIEGMVAELSEMGIDIQLADAAKMRTLVPGIQVRPGAIGAWEPDGGFVNPHRTLSAFASLARQYGAVTRLGVEVTDILVENGRVVGARTTEGDYEAERVVLVAGPWTRPMLQKLGCDIPMKVLGPQNTFLGMPGAELLIEEESGQESYRFDLEEDPVENVDGSHLDALELRGMHPVIIDLEHGLYCRCEPTTKRTRLGFIDYARDAPLAKPEDLEEVVPPEVRAELRAGLVRRIPDYEEQSEAGTIAGWYTLTPDAQAVIGPLPSIEGLFVVSGFSGHGFKLAPMVGEGVAQMLFGEPISAFEPEFFDPARFQEVTSWSGNFGL